MLQSSFELTGYITETNFNVVEPFDVSKLFRAYGLYNQATGLCTGDSKWFSKLFRAYGLYNALCFKLNSRPKEGFQSSFELTGYITMVCTTIVGNVMGFKALSSLRVI